MEEYVKSLLVVLVLCVILFFRLRYQRIRKQTTSKKSKLATGIVIVVFISFIVWSMAMIALNVKQVRDICSDIQPGFSIEKAEAIVKSHGITDTRFERSLLKDEEKNIYIWLIPAERTLGEYTCFITHNEKMILSTEMSTPPPYTKGSE